VGPAAQSGRPEAAFCFRVEQERPGWSLLQPIPSNKTVDLAALVCSAPEFLGMDGGEAPCQAAVVLSERGDARVVVAVDEVGGITLVGCPSQLTRDALTTVVQELLVFTGRLWRMPSEEFSSVFEKRLGRSLGDYFSSRVAIGWSESGFRSGLGRSLERGRFPVVLLVTDSNQEVVEAVAHLRFHNIEVKSIGVELYESSGVEIVMPRVLEILEPEPHEDREPARQGSPSTPYEPRTPTRPQSSAAGPGVTESGSRPGPTPAKKMPWSDEPAPPVVETEPAAVDQGADTSVFVSPIPTGSDPAGRMPWSDEPAAVSQGADTSVYLFPIPTGSAPTGKMPCSDEPAPPVSEVVPPPVQSKPASPAPPPAPKPAAPKAGWDGTMPGVMAGRRPLRRSQEGTGTHKGHEQASGRH
jgi:hypothetical protein